MPGEEHVQQARTSTPGEPVGARPTHLFFALPLAAALLLTDLTFAAQSSYGLVSTACFMAIATGVFGLLTLLLALRLRKAPSRIPLLPAMLLLLAAAAVWQLS